jgi:proteasome assembly chaperone (PAC2) family protein
MPADGAGGRARYRGGVLEIENWPQLRDPVMVIAIAGWVDAGEAGSLAASTIAEQLESSQVIGHYDLRDLVDLQQTRPTVTLVDGATREINWPSVELIGGRAGRDVVVIRGPEPSLQWPTFVKELAELANRLGVKKAFTLGGIPAMVSHRRPVSVLTVATSESLAEEVGAAKTDYRGPTGVQTVLQVTLGQTGTPTVGLWAQVPHYVAGNASPPAVRALLGRIMELGGLQLDLSELDGQASGYAEKVEEGLTDRPDVAELVEAIESETVEPVSCDQLADEIEKFLRDQ